LKTRLRGGAIAACALVLAAAGGATAATDPNGFLTLAPDQISWEPYPAADGTGVELARIYGDPSKPGLYVVRIRFPAGVMSTPHHHPEDRVAVVLKGTWWTGVGGTMNRPGTAPVPVGGVMVHPKGQLHYDGAKGEEVILQLVGVGPSGHILGNPSGLHFAKE
jgi:quercetin dioxygenase-like cupin family protein